MKNEITIIPDHLKMSKSLTGIIYTILGMISLIYTIAYFAIGIGTGLRLISGWLYWLHLIYMSFILMFLFSFWLLGKKSIDT